MQLWVKFSSICYIVFYQLLHKGTERNDISEIAKESSQSNKHTHVRRKTEKNIINHKTHNNTQHQQLLKQKWNKRKTRNQWKKERKYLKQNKQTHARSAFFVKLCVYSCIKANEKPKTKPSKNKRSYVSAEQNNTKHTISETMCECKLFNHGDKQKRTNLKSSANNKTSKTV